VKLWNFGPCTWKFYWCNRTLLLIIALGCYGQRYYHFIITR